ncbi:MAG: bifunctional UDP-3-O-[3-hydroxymyristoyl] N-acetylglucosamine deacetylase/3-hydroxyacyl-ACP dehydratase [Gemmatimonadota bacterium]|nr:bifunctional UDP-3-O-[3-hydroxymyristoyl] N-acetylglucosamine deacetylase/3-hydroxyacyl-ACP dehydratase [Candidatus Palauibacterales bacterium]
MTPKQQTLAATVEFEGAGLHSAENATIVFRPAPAEHGIVFRRTDLEGAPEVPARVEHVAEVDRGIVLRKDGASVRTVEHVLSAVAALEIDNVLIELSCKEPPAVDGSAAPFAERLREAGTEAQEAAAHVWSCDVPFAVEEGSSRYAVVPDRRYVISGSIDFDHPLIRRQHASYAICSGGYAEDIAPARTFGFMKDAERLRASGLALGADTSNTVVLTAEGLHEGVVLRFADEFIRHKILDVVGDLALVGRRIRAQIIAERPGHRGNIELARAIARRAQKAADAQVIDINQILRILPHRFPFLLVDRVIEYEKGKRIVGIKNVTINEPFFVGHFPGLPIMPGVLIIEAMAQVGGLLLMDTLEDPDDKIVYFMSLDKVKFRRPVTPGDQIEFEVKLVQLRRRVARMKGVGRVDGKVVAEAELKAQVVDR